MKSRLIQRLHSPSTIGNSWSFGGGLRNGGLSKEAMEIINPIFSFDYMGNSEFEMGNIPRAFQTIGLYSSKGEGISGKVDLVRPAYFLCSNEQKDYVIQLITKISEEGDYGSLRLEEPTYFKESLEGDKYSSKNKGWIELDNGFMFFVDEEMFKKTKEIFEIK